MRILLPCLFLLFATAFTGCQSNNPGRASHQEPARVRGPGPEQAYRIGVNHGRSDRQRGRIPNPARHDAGIPLRSRPDFARGYDIGYRQVGPVVSRPRAPRLLRPRFRNY